jgi:hypothetical protein
MPVWLGERGTADAGDPIHAQADDRGRIASRADDRGERLMVGAAIGDYKKHRGGPIRLPLLEQDA